MAIYRGPGGSGDATGDSANQAQIASAFATQAGASATAAAGSATTASNAATAAQTAQTAAELAETNAETAETNAEAAQTAAEAAQTAAEAAQTAAELAETNAETAETNAEAAQAAAEAAQLAAEAAQTAAELAETNAETAETNAEAAQTAAEGARDSALAAYDNFDDRYLGAKASDPTLDNDGDALISGALYFNTVSSVMKVYDGASWLTTYVPTSGLLVAANNLSDLTDASVARTNLGGLLVASNNLSDLTNAATARANLGLLRVVEITDGSSVTINADTTDIAFQTNTQVAGTLTINAPTGTPISGQKIIFRLQSTNQQTFSWNAAFQGSNDAALPTLSTGSDKFDYVGFIYNTVTSKWQMIAKNFGF